MILNCSYEELNALRSGAHGFLQPDADDGPTRGAGLAVAAPPESRALVSALARRLGGSIGIQTLADQHGVQGAVEAVVSHLEAEMEARVLDAHPADEDAVAAYFDYAHALSVLGRLRDMRAEMEALIEVVVGTSPDEYLASNFLFPD